MRVLRGKMVPNGLPLLGPLLMKVFPKTVVLDRSKHTIVYR